MTRKTILVTVLLLGSVLVGASAVSATHEGRCADTKPSLIHDACNAATCPADEPIEDCLQGDSKAPSGKDCASVAGVVGACVADQFTIPGCWASVTVGGHQVAQLCFN